MCRLEAATDLQEIVDYYAGLGATEATTVILGFIHRSIALRAQLGFRRAAHFNAGDGTYEIAVPGLPYVVSYHIAAEFIDVFGIAHSDRGLEHRRRP